MVQFEPFQCDPLKIGDVSRDILYELHGIVFLRLLLEFHAETFADDWVERNNSVGKAK